MNNVTKVYCQKLYFYFEVLPLPLYAECADRPSAVVFAPAERRFEMFLQYSRNGIVIASIEDIMTSFHSLIGSSDQNELPTPPSTGGCVE